MIDQETLLPRQTPSEAITEARQIVEDAQAQYQPVKTFALFSGGNDSTTMLFTCMDQIDAAVHINTGIGIEQTRDFVREVCRTWRVPLIEKRTPPEVYRNDVLKRGFPGPRQHRIMYHQLKRERLRDLRREYVPRGSGNKLLLLTGERAYESQRRMGYGGTTTRSEGSMIWCNPIHYFDSRMLNAVRERFHVPRNQVSDLLHRSGECLCGAFARKEELDEIELWFPETATEIRDLEAQVRAAGHEYAAWGGQGQDSRPAPGPLCSSCTLWDEAEKNASTTEEGK